MKQSRKSFTFTFVSHRSVNVVWLCENELKFHNSHRLLALSFCKKGDLSIHYADEYRYSDLIETLQKSWNGFIDEAMSFIVKDKNDQMIGISLNKRFHFDPTEVCIHPRPLSLTANVNAYAHFMYSQIM